MYVELHARSAFSFLEGAALPEELAAVCAEQGMSAAALLDRDGVYGSPRFHLAAEKSRLRAHVGAEVTSEEGWRYPLLVSSRAGYQNLCRLITRMKLRAAKGEGSVSAKEVAEHAEGLICLTGGDEGPFAHALAQNGTEAASARVRQLTQIFGCENVYVELQRHFSREEEARNQAAIDIARKFHLPFLATNSICYAQAQQREILDVFTCIRHHTTLAEAGRLLARNSERRVKSPAEMAHLFSDVPEAVANTELLSSRLQFTLKDLGYEFPKYPVPDGKSQMQFLRERTRDGMIQRYGSSNERAQKQIERELALISKLDLSGYFLIVWDIIRFCRKKNILVQGRGSAANSAVCYALGITAVDPVGMELLFERFLSEERGEWPDIDLDLPSGDQRERAIQYVYERYGKLGAAMTANVITYRGRYASREIGKVLGFEPEMLDRLTSLVGAWEFKDENDKLDCHFREAGLDLSHHLIRKFLDLCLMVQDLPRHLGQHSGGMVVCQGQLDSVVPLEPATMPGRVVVQWDKDDCADMGIVKVDLLGLGMMAVLEDTIQIIRNDYKEEVDLAHLPQGDSAVYSALQKADTIGMFQIESRAQMSCLPRLHPACFYDIVVQVAIIRPGPIVGEMVNPYLNRRQGREPVDCLHPALEPVLSRTLGVPLFQEQLLRMAMIAAGFSGGEAEDLRRAFGFKRSERRMKDVEKKLQAGMGKNGLSYEVQEKIVRSITSFALYGFPESHAASFALLAYASAYLKCHYLAAFTAAMLNNQPMGFYNPATLVKDAQRHGLRIKPIDITRSDWLCTLEQIPEKSRGTAACGTATPGCVCEPAPENNSVVGALLAAPLLRTGTNIESEEPIVDAVTKSAPEARHNLAQCGSAGYAADKIQSAVGAAQTPHSSVEIKSHEFSLRLGLRYVKGLHEEIAKQIVHERNTRSFTSIEDLKQRVPNIQKSELKSLAAIGALNFIEPKHKTHRRDALWQIERAARHPGPLFETNKLSPVRALLAAPLDQSEQNSAGAKMSGQGFSRAVKPKMNAAVAAEGISAACGTATPGCICEPAPENNSAVGALLAAPLLRTGTNIESEEPIADVGTESAPEARHNLAQRGSAGYGADKALSAVGATQRDCTAFAMTSNSTSDSTFGSSPLSPMSTEERLIADFHGTGLTIGPHPLAYHRASLKKYRLRTAIELQSLRNGTPVRIAGSVVVRQRPGTAKGFVFLSMEDETGIANVIITPQLFQQNRTVIVHNQFLLIEGTLQNQDNVISVKAAMIQPLQITQAETVSHDFH
ncbi:MAG: DNA polymerase III subunit alpha [Candidatus Acidiferrales bacterium]